ncbi:MAG: DoxX family protein [Casimicrobiaceae bacterium]
MSGQNDFAALIGRILLALLFVPAGFSTITGFSGTVGYITSQGVPLPEAAVAIRILIELGGGLLVLIGWKTRWAALAFIVYLIVITPIFHGFWSVPEAQKMAQEISFWKNMGILGAFFLLLAFGPGRFSVDRQ